MSVAKGRRQFVIVDRPAALAGRPADWRETSFVGETAAFSYRVDRRLFGSWLAKRVSGKNPDLIRLLHPLTSGSGTRHPFAVPNAAASAKRPTSCFRIRHSAVSRTSAIASQRRFQPHGFGVQLPAAGFGHAIVLPLAPAFGRLPFSLKPTSIFQPVEGRIERALPNLKRLSRDLLNSLNHSVSVNGPKSGDLQEQHVERSLEKLGVVGCLAIMPRHSRYQDTAGMPRMPRYGCAPVWCS
jgi:hypothetical protein